MELLITHNANCLLIVFKSIMMLIAALTDYFLPWMMVENENVFLAWLVHDGSKLPVNF